MYWCKLHFLPFVVLCFQQEFVFSYWCTEVGYRVHTTVCMLNIVRVSTNIMQFQLLPRTCFANSVHFCVETDLYWVLSIYWKACNKHTCNKIKSSEYSNGTNSKINNMHMKKCELAIMKTYKKGNQNLFRSTKLRIIRVVSKIEVADWQLKVTVPGMEPIRILLLTRDSELIVDWGKQHSKNFLSKAIHTDSVPGTTTFSCQSATSILDATRPVSLHKQDTAHKNNFFSSRIVNLRNNLPSSTTTLLAFASLTSHLITIIFYCTVNWILRNL